MRFFFRLLLLSLIIFTSTSYATKNSDQLLDEKELKVPDFVEDKNVLGHIFRKAEGHFTVDTRENRQYILGAVSHPGNKAGVTKQGEELFFKIMPDGYQAWARVANGMIKNGGFNRYARRWVADPDHDVGGEVVPIRYHFPTSNETDFKIRLLFNRLVEHYNSYHPKNPITFRNLTRGLTQGVEHQTGLITNLFDNRNASPTDDLKVTQESEHIFFMPTDDGLFLEEQEIQQILSELAIGVFIHESIPYLSLHFHRELTQYPIIHPAYQNTMVGHMISMLDYYMKGFIHGMYYEESFISEWETHQNRDEKFLKSNSINLQEYCQKHFKGSYLTFKEIYKQLEADLPNSATSKIDYNLCRRLFRITAKQDSIKHADNLYLLGGDFDVFYSLEPIQGNAIDPVQYEMEKRACEKMCEQIKTIMPQMPVFKKYFQALSLINFFTYYYSTLKEAGKVPILTPQYFSKKDMGCPSIFPYFPIESFEEKLQIKVLDLLNFLSQEEKKIVFGYIRNQNRLETEATQAVDSAFRQLASSYDVYTSNFDFNKNASEFLRTCKIIDQRFTEKMDATLVLVKLKNHKEPITGKMITTLIAKIDASLKQVSELMVDVEKEIREAKRQHLPDDELIAEQNELKKMHDEFINDKKMWELWSQGSLIPAFEKMHLELGMSNDTVRLSAAKFQGSPNVGGGCGISLVDKTAENDALAFHLHDKFHSNFLSLTHNKILKVQFEQYSGILFKMPFEHFPITNEEEKILSIGYFSTPKCPLDNAKVQAFHAITTQDDALFKVVAKEIGSWNFQDPFDVPIMHYAARERNPFFLTFLLDQDVQLEAKDIHGFTALHHAAQWGNLAGLDRLFRKAPFLLDSVSRNGETALYLAAQNNHVDCVRFLLSVGANPDLATKGLKMNPLICSIYLGWAEVALELLNHSSVDLEQFIRGGLSALHFAVESKNALVTARLCELGADVLRSRMDGYTALHIAVEEGWLDGVNVLLSKCPYIDLNARTISGKTPLQLALDHEHFEIVHLLRKKGAY